jgi:predicted metallopeptidase
MRYEPALDIKERVKEIVQILGMEHIDLDRLECLRSYGSSSRRTIARCHALGKLMQKAMKTDAFYAIEFLELFNRMKPEEQDKVIIHELMHIPKTFGGGFRQHDFVCENNIDKLHRKFQALKRDKKPMQEQTSSQIALNEYPESKHEKQISILRFPFWR